jgi:hypothetical protein
VLAETKMLTSITTSQFTERLIYLVLVDGHYRLSDISLTRSTRRPQADQLRSSTSLARLRRDRAGADKPVIYSIQSTNGSLKASMRRIEGRKGTTSRIGMRRRYDYAT